jgi:hypothetical protein
MNDINFAEICWGDYMLDGRIVLYKKFEVELPLIEEEFEEDTIDSYIDEVLRNY